MEADKIGGHFLPNVFPNEILNKLFCHLFTLFCLNIWVAILDLASNIYQTYQW